jgi:uncharacterized protein YjdB
MIRRSAIILLSITALFTGAACSNTPSATTLSISVNQVVIGIGGGQQLVVTASMTDGSLPNVTGSATFVSANPAVATVSTTGIVTGVSAGSTTITVTYGTFTTAAGVIVTG